MNADAGSVGPGQGQVKPSRRPWFRLFVTDFLGDSKVQAMSMAARGVYLTLLCYQWQEGSVPSDEATLRRIAGGGMPKRRWLEVWAQVAPCFEIDDHGMYANRRLCHERQNADMRASKNRAAGAKGAAARWQAPSKRDGKRMAIPEPEPEPEEEEPTPTPPTGRGAPSKNGSFDPLQAELPWPSFRETWEAWCQHRREIRKKLTPLACSRSLAKLERMGELRATSAIEHSIAQGWTGIHEPDRQRATAERNDQLSEFLNPQRRPDESRSRSDGDRLAGPTALEPDRGAWPALGG